MSRRLKIKIAERLLRKKLKPVTGSRKKCRFESDPKLAAEIDYKNVDFLRSFITERGKMLPARVSGNSAMYQRKLSQQIKIARIMALMPFCSILR